MNIHIHSYKKKKESNSKLNFKNFYFHFFLILKLWLQFGWKKKKIMERNFFNHKLWLKLTRAERLKNVAKLQKCKKIVVDETKFIFMHV